MSDASKFRDRKFVAVLYPDDPTHSACMGKLRNGGYNYAAILHDKDEYEDGEHKGELKKAHWHIVLRFKNAIWNTALAKELGIEANYLQQCKNLDGALVYLVHYGFEEKFQYDLEKVFGPLAVRLASLLADNDESTRALNIFDIIRNSPGVVTYTEVFEKACKSGLYGDFRRMGSGVMYLIKEHNETFMHDLYQEDMQRDRDRFLHFLKNPPSDKWVALARYLEKNGAKIEDL